MAIRAGARWVATNTDATMPSPRGPLPGNGSLVAALRTALGGRAPDVVVGKPEPALFQVAGRATGRRRRCLVVGDRLDTDIEGADRAGMDSLLVLTGVSTPADLLRRRPHAAPDLRRRPTARHCPHRTTASGSRRGRDERARSAVGWRVDAATATGWRLTGTRRRPTATMAARCGRWPPAAWAHPEWTGHRAADGRGRAWPAAPALDRLGPGPGLAGVERLRAACGA